MTMPEGRQLDLHLQLLDRQVQDRDGRMICKVDDLEFDLDETGRPYVTAILIGPRGLGRWVAAVAARLATPDQLQVPQIDFAQVTDIGSAITIARAADELHVAPLEDWVDHYIVARIPGSRHEGE